ncbi:hypothetical protein [Arthrobacter celericrescens]|uniref:hypothetical protein n=1 Tax=Arthrobacter celericrescens TaxID=2320851 RepID=UPI0013C461DD|nr:hypothetical protein [Arthrobacter celericrescens]
MAVWGRAITTVGLIAVLAACEYTEEGDPRPSALAGSVPVSSSPVDSAPPESTADPARERRMALMFEEVAALLGPQQGEPGYEASGSIGNPIPPGGGEGPPPANSLKVSFTVPAGKYVVASACVGDTGAQLTVTDQNGRSIGRVHPCGKATDLTHDLPGGMATVELRGETQGNEGVGTIRLSEASSVPSPKP